MVVPLHKHLIVRAECNKFPTSTDEVSDFLTDVVVALNMKILSGPHVAYVDVAGNKGATGVVVIETSHCAIHVWDEVNPALVQLDVYTCGELDTSVIFDMFRENFDPVKLEYKYLDRENSLVELAAGTEDHTNPMVTGLGSSGSLG